MSDLMDRAVIGMPFDMAMRSHLSRLQFYNRAQAILAERDALLAERDAAFAAGWKAAIEEAQSILRESWDDLSGHAAAGLIDDLPIKPYHGDKEGMK